jgi:hypothetical protein
MIAALALIALTSAPPAIDMAAICKDAQATVLPEDRQAAYDGCVLDEQNARDKLKAKWGHYSAAARSACVGDGGVAQSYVELWTCLEMQPGGSLSLQSSDREPISPPGSPPLPPHAQPRGTGP